MHDAKRGHLVSGPLFPFVIVVLHIISDPQTKLAKGLARQVLKLVFHVSKERLNRDIVDTTSLARHSVFLCPLFGVQIMVGREGFEPPKS